MPGSRELIGQRWDEEGRGGRERCGASLTEEHQGTTIVPATGAHCGSRNKGTMEIHSSCWDKSNAEAGIGIGPNHRLRLGPEPLKDSLCFGSKEAIGGDNKGGEMPALCSALSQVLGFLNFLVLRKGLLSGNAMVMVAWRLNIHQGDIKDTIHTGMPEASFLLL